MAKVEEQNFGQKALHVVKLKRAETKSMNIWPVQLEEGQNIGRGGDFFSAATSRLSTVLLCTIPFQYAIFFMQ